MRIPFQDGIVAPLRSFWLHRATDEYRIAERENTTFRNLTKCSFLPLA
jgi:hypothetical protein